MSDIQTIGSIIGLPNHMQISKQDEKDKTKIYTVAVNPESYSVKMKACYSKSTGMQSNVTTYAENKVNPQSMDIELLFDNTGSLSIIRRNVLEQINDFVSIAFLQYEQGSDVEEREKLQIIWGEMIFYGVLETIKIDYTHFDHSGNPIRAKAGCTFSGGTIQFNKPKRLKKAKKKKKINYSKQKHAVNAVLKYSSYIPLLATQPKTALPKSLRLPSEVAKFIIDKI